MSKGFTVDLSAEKFNIEIVFSGTTRHLSVIVEVCYTDECPTMAFDWDFSPEEAVRITPERAAMLCGMLANYAAMDTAAEEAFAASVEEDFSEADEDGERPFYGNHTERTVTAMIEAFFFGGVVREAAEN